MATTQFSITNETADFLSRPRKMLINNRWVESVSGKTFAVFNPATGEEIARVAEGSQTDVDLAVNILPNLDPRRSPMKIGVR